MLISSQESIARMLGFDRTLSICAKILLEKHKESWDFLLIIPVINHPDFKGKEAYPNTYRGKDAQFCGEKEYCNVFFLPESLHRWIPLAKSQTLLPHRSSLLWRSRRKEQNAITIFKEAGLSHFQTHFIQGIQNDSINCGIYSLTYLECWLNEMPFPTKDKGILVRGKPVDQVAEIDIKKDTNSPLTFRSSPWERRWPDLQFMSFLWWYPSFHTEKQEEKAHRKCILKFVVCRSCNINRKRIHY